MKDELGALALLWLFGICLRITVLAVPPVMPQLHETFVLSAAVVGALASLPVVLFSLVAIPGSLLVARFGAGHVLAAGILACGIASGLRGLAGSVEQLFAATFAMGVGIAIMQPALPAVVRDWLPRRAALGTAVYSNALLVGEAFSASLTIPLVLPAVGGSWRWSMAVWAAPVVLIGLLAVWTAASRDRRKPAGAPSHWWPDWRAPLTWKLGLVSGLASSLYFSSNAFLPDYLAARGRADLLGPALSALNWTQIPASILLLAFATRLTRRRWPFVAMSAAAIACVLGILYAPDGWLVFCAGVLGFTNAFLLILTLALPPLIARPEDVSRLAAALIAIGYLCAFLLPLAGGALWDATGKADAAFYPLLAFAFVALAIASTLRFEPSRPP